MPHILAKLRSRKRRICKNSTLKSIKFLTKRSASSKNHRNLLVSRGTERQLKLEMLAKAGLEKRAISKADATLRALAEEA